MGAHSVRSGAFLLPAGTRGRRRAWSGLPSPHLPGPYRPGERGWIKVKNKMYWRYELERESAMSKRRVRQFV
jgi:hypothetical protein